MLAMLPFAGLWALRARPFDVALLADSAQGLWALMALTGPCNGDDERILFCETPA